MSNQEQTSTTKQIVQQQFGKNAAAYVTSTPHAKGASLARLVALVQPQSHWQTLDIATGAGHTALIFAPHVASVLATDLTPQMLEKAANLAQSRGIENIAFEPADAEALPFEEGRFDLVTCRIAPHHFPNVQLFIEEATRVLRPGGIFAVVDNVVPESQEVSDFANHFEKLRDPSHERCLSIEEWEAGYVKAGLTLLHTETAFKAMRFQEWADNMQVLPEMRAQLHTMLQEASTAIKGFLAPEFGEDGATFRLTEGIFIGQKMG